jgi:biopolymer transport protein ExbB/TolQ
MFSRRLAQVEQRRLREAIAEFGVFWVAITDRPGADEQAAAVLREAGCAGDSLDDIERWHAAQPPERRAASEALEAAVFAMVLRPEQERAILAALAALAPYLGLNTDDSPFTILLALRRTIEECARVGETAPR